MKNSNVTLTTAQAIIRFISSQYVERDGHANPFFAGCFGIFGHGNVAGIGQALKEEGSLPFYLPRNEQAMVHTAIGFAKASNRLRAMVCTSSIGPGATNMVTGAATATINHIPVLLLPGDIFARRNLAPVLQQIESASTQDISVNDCFRPVSRYWDRIERPEQILTSLPEAIRTLTSPADTGAVTLSLPQDTQAEAFDFPARFFEPMTWVIGRPRPDRDLLLRATNLITSAKCPLIIAGGGVIYSDACLEVVKFAEKFGIPVTETMSGKGAIRFDHPLSLGGIGVTGTAGANEIASVADVVIGIGTRYTDFTTASKTAFLHPDVQFVNINISEFDAAKHRGIMLTGDARCTIEELMILLEGFTTSSDYRRRISRLNKEWDAEVSRLYTAEHKPLPSQAEVIGAVNEVAGEKGVVVCAAGSLPGDLHKLWRTCHNKQYHMEYGYSCMGYEIAGGLGVKMAMPEREVFVMLGDGSYLMMSQEIVTSLQEGIKLTIVLIDNHGFASIGGLAESSGVTGGYGTRYRYRNAETNNMDGETISLDFVKNAAGLGALTGQVQNITELRQALVKAVDNDRTTVIVIETDIDHRVGSYGAWWDVPIAEVSQLSEVISARQAYVENREKERFFYGS